MAAIKTKRETLKQTMNAVLRVNGNKAMCQTCKQSYGILSDAFRHYRNREMPQIVQCSGCVNNLTFLCRQCETITPIGHKAWNGQVCLKCCRQYDKERKERLKMQKIIQE
jgi:hypothetical protein